MEIHTENWARNSSEMNPRPAERGTGATAAAATLAMALGISLGGLVTAGCGEEPAPEAPAVRPVKILEIGAGGGGITREFPGKISAAQTADVAFEVSGKIVELPVDEGQRVEEGDVLARLDPRDFESQRDAAVASERAARAEAERTRALFEADVAPKQQLDVAERNYDVMEARAATARKALEDAVLRAPFAGEVARKLVDDFANIKAKDPILILQDNSHLEIVIDVAEADYVHLQPGLDNAARTARGKPRVIVSSIPDREFPARIKELAGAADPTTRTYAATLAFENPPDVNILPGMTAKVRIGGPGTQTALESIWIPARAARTDDTGEAFVWVVDATSMKVQRTPVTLGELSGDLVQVTAGLEGGQQIATSGVHHLREGMQVHRLEK
jgi:RND family efflux transporter MFP subunit